MFEILRELDPDTSARSIVMHYIKRYQSTRNPYFANVIFKITGHYPDGLETWGLDPDKKLQGVELDFVNDPDMIY